MNGRHRQTYGLGRDAMKEQKPQGCRVSRRTFVRGAAGAVVAEVMAAPHVLAQSKTPWDRAR